jgi:hypothetical protein
MGKKLFNFSGLRTNMNPLSLADGSLVQADNITISGDGKVSVRNGFGKLFDLASFDAGNVIAYIWEYMDVIHNSIVNTTSNTMKFFYNATLYSTQDYTDTSVQGFQFFKQIGSIFYKNTFGVLFQDSLGGTLRKAGAIKALGGSAVLTGIAGFMKPNCQVAYRATWTATDANDVIREGAPSPRIELTNASSYFRDVYLKIFIPPDATVTDRLRVYRSGFSINSGTTAYDDMALVYDNFPSAGDITNQYIVITDTIPTEVRGSFLYTNSNFEGLAQENSRPPLPKAMNLYRDLAIYANTSTRYNVGLKLLNATPLLAEAIIINGVSLLGIQNEILVDRSFNTDAPWVRTGDVQYDGALFRMVFQTNGTVPAGTLKLPNASMPPIIANNKRYLFRYQITNGTLASNPDTLLTLTGAMVSETIYLDMTDGTHEIEFYAGAAAVGSDFVITLSGVGPDTLLFYLDNVSCVQMENANNKFVVYTAATTAENIARTARSLVEAVNVSVTAGLADIYAYYTSGYNDTPGSMFFEVESFVTGFTISTPTASVGASFSPNTTAVVTAKNEYKKNAIYVSKDGRPHYVPALNFQEIGSASSEILSVFPYRENCYIFKDDGHIYRLSGSKYPLAVELFDSITKMRLPLLANGFNNSMMYFSNFGFVIQDDAGLSVNSFQLNNFFKQYFTGLETVYANSFSHEAEKKYYAFFNDEVGYVLNGYTNEWARITKRSKMIDGVNLPADEAAYLFDEIPDPGVGSNNFYRIMKQRITDTADDYYDDVVSCTLSAITASTVTYGSYFGVPPEIGDVLVQGSINRRITDISGFVLTLAGGVSGLVNGTANIYHSIEFILETAPIHFGEPDKLKLFQEIIFNFGDVPEIITVGVSSDGNTTREEWDIEVTPGENQVRTWLPLGYQMAKWIKIYLKVKRAFYKVDLLGMEVDAEVVNQELLTVN